MSRPNRYPLPLPDDVKAGMQALARSNERTLAAEIIVACREHIYRLTGVRSPEDLASTLNSLLSAWRENGTIADNSKTARRKKK